jgi:regulator of sigma E protease
MDIAIKAAQLLLSLSILVIFHEFGHFFFAKLFNTRVEKFYLFFDPWFSLFKFKKGETEYGIGWLPLGGYVKISGMIDESMDKEQMALEPQPWEFRSKTAWQRLLIMLGGVTVNFLLAFTIYWLVLYAWGDKYLPNANLNYGVVADSVAQKVGIANGDKIIALNGNEITDFSEIRLSIILDDTKTITVDRNGQKIDLPFTMADKANMIKSQSFFIEPAYPFVIAGFSDPEIEKTSGLKINDQIIGMNGKYMAFFNQYPEELMNYAGQEVNLHVMRGSDSLVIQTILSENGKIGVAVKSPADFFQLETKEYGFFEALPAGIAKGFDKIRDYLKQFPLIFNPETEAYKSVGGFIAIGNIFPAFWDWEAFWSMTALLSIMLAVVNILPIPALDGGHVMFLLYEIIVGKKPSDKFLEYAQVTGMVMLLALLVFANGNDIIKLFN